MTSYTRDSSASTFSPPDGKKSEVVKPGAEALEVAAAIKRRVGRRTSAPVRAAFLRANVEGGAPASVQGFKPPMARLVSVGRGGDVRLKLELSFLWFAANPPHDLTYPARAWAALLGLKDPGVGGARRVRQALLALEGERLVEVQTKPGRPSTIVLQDEGGDGRPYVLPGEAYSRSRGGREEWRDRYIRLPDELWTSGWLSILSGAALSMLLVLYVERAGQSSETDLWFSPRIAQERYGLSDELRAKGLRELRAAGLVTARRKSATRDVLDFQRLRNTYRIVDSRLGEPAAVPTVINPEIPPRMREASASDIFALMPRNPSGT